MNYLEHLPDSAQLDIIRQLHEEKQRWVNQEKKGFLRYRKPYENLCRFPAQHLQLNQDTVVIGHPDEVNSSNREKIDTNLKSFMPWRKGPFSIFGIDIDAEWRSEQKWQRVLPHLPDLKGKRIADIGCNNGYYMFRMAGFEPEFVLGFEPSVQHYYTFKALNGMAGLPKLDVDLLGVEHISYFRECFDLIFLMGIIYHRSSPIDVLRDTIAALRPGGTLIIESQAIPGQDSVALFPEKTYAKAPGNYFIPTGTCLVNWLKRAGFVNIDWFHTQPMSSDEQRRTEWMVFESYNDYLNPEDPSLTIEGYPAPVRVLISAQKKG